MHGMRQTFEKSFWTFAIIAIISLAPSAGLVTLVVPDLPYGSVIDLPDGPHISKRALDDTDHHFLDIATASYRIHPKLLAFGATAAIPTACKRIFTQAITQIRAPPAA